MTKRGMVDVFRPRSSEDLCTALGSKPNIGGSLHRVRTNDSDHVRISARAKGHLLRGL
jgi:hypothetical protein